MNQYYNYEIYTIDPVTRTTGWDILNLSVKAETRVLAKEKLKKFPNFDVIILFNHEFKENESADFLITQNYPEFKILERINL